MVKYLHVNRSVIWERHISLNLRLVGIHRQPLEITTDNRCPKCMSRTWIDIKTLRVTINNLNNLRKTVEDFHFKIMFYLVLEKI